MTRRALICGYAPPQHDRDSGSRRLWHLMEFLREAGWTLSFLTASQVGEDRYAEDLRRRGTPVYDGTVTRPEDVLASGRFDLAICAYWQVAEFYLPLLREVSPETSVIVDSVDLHFVREARRVFARGVSPGRARSLGSSYGSETAAELSVYAAADGVLAVSSGEAEFLNGLVGDPGLAFWVPDAEDLATSPIRLRDRAGIIFVGSFSHLPNVDALEYFCADIAPLLDRSLLERHPLSIVGAGLDEGAPPAARRMQHAQLIGWTPSLTPYIEGARVSVVPLRYGAGTKRKVLQALMVGTPVVTTAVGAEGLDLVPDKHVLVAEEPAAFAHAVERVLQDDALWRRLSRAGRRQVAANHSTEAVRARLLAAVDAALARTRKRPILANGGRKLYEYRTRLQEYPKLVPELREALPEFLGKDETLLVFSEGCEDLLRLNVSEARHFPPLEIDGAGARPSASGRQVVLPLLQEEIDRGASYLVVPKRLQEVLRYYPELLEHLETNCKVREVAGFLLFDLRGPLEDSPGDESAPTVPVAAPRGRRRRKKPPARLVAFYLPQFHPIPENDEWWGEGFTEWTNVVKAKPLFTGHYQPHLPGDLGFYDLRLPEIGEAQAELARKAGIEAFCYYHYWFGGKRLLGRPLDQMLESGRPDFPFCLCWANEPWSRRWDGQDNDVLQPQTYSAKDDREHIRWLIPALSDPRALKVEGKPVFMVYQARDLPDPAQTVKLWRREVRRAGLPGIYLMTVETGWDAGWDATKAGFDAKVLFQPQFSTLSTVPRLEVDGPQSVRVFDYAEAWPILSRPDPVPYRRYETVCTGWDNSPRTNERGWLLHNSTPEAYEAWLRQAIDRVRDEPRDHRLVFLNAWNEWAEGAYLEPDKRHEHGYLNATRRALEDAVQAPQPKASHAQQDVLRIEEPDQAAVDAALAAAPPPRARALAFYLPQFHPIPENDEWWGKGFTEWTNVARARPLFSGHYQPHLPANLGFYDLRLAEVRERQASLAREHGIVAFCYWHYWFLGKRLLERPFEETLESGRPDFPFLLAWANEPWSRRWLGEDKEVLLKQEHSPSDDLAHAHWLAEAFADPRYLRVHGRPPLLIYRPTYLPDPRQTTEVIKRVCTQAGLPEPLLLGVNAFKDIDYRTLGFDGTVDFEPQLSVLGDVLEDDGLKTCDYVEARRLMREQRAGRSFPVYPTVVAGWDNTPRRGEHGIVLNDSTPANFEHGLRETVAPLLGRPFEDRLLFLNAWNEWAEGNHLEPDRRYGLGHLEAVRRVLLGDASEALGPAERPAVEVGV
jgi:lipopolysaccharide biosynthesis protein/glycosyltransferase involved in cell wall biosynthesis